MGHKARWATLAFVPALGACAALLGVDPVDYAEGGAPDAGETDGAHPIDAPSDDRDAPGEADVAVAHLMVKCPDIDGGLCLGAEPVCCSHSNTKNVCAATAAACSPDRISVIAVACDDFSDCDPGFECCGEHSNGTFYGSACVPVANGCSGVGPALMCDFTKDVCPPDAGTCQVILADWAMCL